MDVRAPVKPSLTVKRRFKASPAKVFAAWTDPEKVKHWMGPGVSTPVLTENDARAGGRYRWVTRSANGDMHDVGGTYREVIANEKLVFTWAWASTPERESVVTVLLKPDGEGTLLTVIHEELFDDETRDRHQNGWNGALDKLEKFVTAE
jgi:uncharacterized protein YndB with AHSA1/START domain